MRYDTTVRAHVESVRQVVDNDNDADDDGNGHDDDNDVHIANNDDEGPSRTHTLQWLNLFLLKCVLFKCICLLKTHAHTHTLSYPQQNKIVRVEFSSLFLFVFILTSPFANSQILDILRTSQ